MHFRFTSYRHIPFILTCCMASLLSQAQQKDSVQPKPRYFSGSLGLTTNGISIIPTFSLNSPAMVNLFSLRLGKFSVDPDMRLASDLKRGTLLCWLRYYPVESKRFTLRVGAHPAINFTTIVVKDSTSSMEIVRARRFVAGEISPNFLVSDHLTVGVYYLRGHGLQKDGPQNSHFLTLNAGITGLHPGKKQVLNFFPAFYYLKLDQTSGTYFTATATLSRQGLPFVLQGTINQTIQSNIAGNKNFMWSLTLSYLFRKHFAS